MLTYDGKLRITKELKRFKRWKRNGGLWRIGPRIKIVMVAAITETYVDDSVVDTRELILVV